MFCVGMYELTCSLYHPEGRKVIVELMLFFIFTISCSYMDLRAVLFRTMHAINVQIHHLDDNG